MTDIRFSIFDSPSNHIAVASDFSGVRGSHFVATDCGPMKDAF